MKEPPRGKNIELRIAQFEAFRDHGRALGIAKAVVRAKIANGGAVLDHYRRHNDASEDFGELMRQANDIRALIPQVRAAVASLDGVEDATIDAWERWAPLSLG